MRGGAGSFFFIIQRQSLIRGICERGSDDHDGACRHKRADDASSDDLALASGEVDGEAGGAGRGRSREEGAGEGENFESAVKSDNSTGSSGLTKSDVGDGAAAAEDADAALTPASELGDGFGDVGSAGNLHDVAAEGVGAVSGDKDGGFGLIFGAGRAAAGPAGADVDLAFLGLLGGVVVVVVIAGGVVDGEIGVAFAELMMMSSGRGVGCCSSRVRVYYSRQPHPHPYLMPAPPRIRQPAFLPSFLITIHYSDLHSSR